MCYLPKLDIELTFGMELVKMTKFRYPSSSAFDNFGFYADIL